VPRRESLGCRIYAGQMLKAGGAPLSRPTGSLCFAQDGSLCHRKFGGHGPPYMAQAKDCGYLLGWIMSSEVLLATRLLHFSMILLEAFDFKFAAF